MKYKGIELEGLDKKVKLSHSRVMETDEGTDWIDKLLTCDKAALTPTQFHEVSALSSVINMDYQICNGGISQYVFNGYHEDCPPYSDDDVAHLGQSGQGSFDFWIGSRSSRWMGASEPTSTYRAMWLFSARHMRSTSASHTESTSRSMKGHPTGCPLFLGMGESFPRVHEKGCVLYM